MILSGREIVNQVDQGRIVIDPFKPENIGPNSYDIHIESLFTYSEHLTGRFIVPEKLGELEPCKPLFPHMITQDLLERGFDHLAMDSKLMMDNFSSDSLYWVLYPGILYLGSTFEYTETPFHAPMLEGRSSIGRLGIFIHATAGFGDVGFKGKWTLELSVVQPVLLRPYTRIGQIYYHEICGDYERYSGRYCGDMGVAPSRLYPEGLKK
jgi:dCTP deaminase